MAKIFEKLIFGGLHEKHAVQGGIWVPTQHLTIEANRYTHRLFLSTDRMENKSSNNSSIIPWPESASELYQPSDSCLSEKLLPTFEDRGYHMVSVTDPHGLNLSFLDWSRYFFFQAAPQMYSRA
jgi:hypothetical protein